MRGGGYAGFFVIGVFECMGCMDCLFGFWEFVFFRFLGRLVSVFSLFGFFCYVYVEWFFFGSFRGMELFIFLF